MPALLLEGGSAPSNSGLGIDEPAADATRVLALVGVMVCPQLLGGAEPRRVKSEGRELGPQNG